MLAHEHLITHAVTLTFDPKKIDAYTAAFLNTPLQTRYARASDVGSALFGFHEDYFPSFTGKCNAFNPQMPSCSDDGWWNLEYGLANEVPAARQKASSAPILKR